MDPKKSYNILVTDNTPIEWRAAKFIWAYNLITGLKRIGTDIKWKNPPKWAKDDVLHISCLCIDFEGFQIKLFRFGDTMPRDFYLDALDIKFDGVLFIVDLGLKQFWESLIYREENTISAAPPNTLMLPSPNRRLTKKESLASLAVRMRAFGDITRIWGLEVFNQIEGAKLILAIKSSPESVPVSFIEKYLQIQPEIDVLERSVEPEVWSDFDFPKEILDDTLSRLSQIIAKC